MQVEVHVDFESKNVIVLTEKEDALPAPALSMTNVKVIEDSDGAILRGTLVETLPRGFRPRGPFRVAQFTRTGKVVDRRDSRVVRSTPAAIVTPANVYYLEKR